MLSSTWKIFLEEFYLYLKSYFPLFWQLKNGVDFSFWKGSELVKSLINHLLSHFQKVPLSFRILFFVVLSWIVIFLVIRALIHSSKSLCNCSGDMRGKTVLITGANTSIGFEMTLDLLKRGSRVIMACKSLRAGIEACKKIIHRTGQSNIIVKKLDLSSLESVRFFSECILKEEERLDVLVLQETMLLSKKYTTEDNLELLMANNYFGHFLLTNLLYPILSKSGRISSPSRIVIRLHSCHRWGNVDINNLNSESSFENFRAFASSQRATMMKVEPNDGVPYLHGHKDITSFIKCFFDFTPYEASQTGIHLCVSEVIKPGNIYFSCKSATDLNNGDERDEIKSVQLWNKTLEILEELS
ncbi:retinol dehydrogenase 11 isoform X2 [Lepeophtheirus salmonis]|uniref:retinol dehydrogenase 11 isoform X2 n=1 Tax=Lepeophtheirus salmonis TaxID=72036 RepID=UPI003AF39E14